MDPWRWLRALLILPLPLWLVVQARRGHVVSPLLDQVAPWLLNLLAAAAGGMLCHVLVGRLCRHGVPAAVAVPVVAGPLLAVLAGVPADRWDLSSVIALTLVAIAMGGYLRFVVEEQTLGGFVAGLTLALAAVCDLATLGYMAAFVAAVPFVAGSWARQVSATTAILAVLAYPSVTMYLGWLYVQWRFAGTVVLDVPTPAPGPAPGFDVTRGAVAAAAGLAHAPMYVAVGVAVALRARPALPAYLLPVVVIALLTAAGVRQAPQAVNLLLTAVAVTAIRAPVRRRQSMMLAAVAAAQVALTLIWAAPH